MTTTHKAPPHAAPESLDTAAEGLDLTSALGDALAAVEARERRHVTTADSESAAERGRDLAETRALQAQVVQLTSQVAQLQAQLGHAQEQLAALRRVAQRHEVDLPLQGTRKALEQLVAPLDNLTAVVHHLRQAELLSPAGHEAVSMLEAEWARALARLDVTAFDAVGHPFDGQRHEIIARQHDPAQPPGTVLRQAGRGYLWQGKVLRAAAVVVNQGS